MWSSATRHRRSSDMLQNLNLPYPSLSRPGKQQLPIYKRQRLVTIILIIFAVLLTIWALIRSFSPTSKELEVQPPYAGPYESLVDDGTLGFLPLKEAREICQRRRWEPYGTRVCAFLRLSVLKLDRFCRSKWVRYHSILKICAE